MSKYESLMTSGRSGAFTRRTRERPRARERTRHLHDWRASPGLNSLCDICLLRLRPLLCFCLSFLYPSVSRPLFSSLSFFLINEDVKPVPFFWRLPMTEQIRNRERNRGEEKEESDLLNSEQKTSSLPVKSAAAAKLWISETGHERGMRVRLVDGGLIIGSPLPKIHKRRLILTRLVKEFRGAIVFLQRFASVCVKVSY